MSNNIGSYNLNNVNQTGYNQVYTSNNNNNVQQQNVGFQQNNFASDAVNTTQNRVGPVPDVKLGWLDKVSSGFSNNSYGGVFKSDINLKRYQSFQNSVKNNPSQYLEQGTGDSVKTLDLQKKLKALGFKVNTNGTFGGATGKAVVEFKKSLGMHDGFLDKSQNYAYTSTVTPQVWGQLNSRYAESVGITLPNSGGSIASVSQQEMAWANNLLYQVQYEGKVPNDSEKQQYDSIRQRLQMSTQNPMNNVQNNIPVAPPTDQEMGWAKDLLNRVQNFGASPSESDKQKYADIQNREKAYLAYMQNQQNQPNQNTGTNNQVSQQEMAWAKDFAHRYTTGQPVQQWEEQKYNEIQSKLNNQQSNPVINQPNNTMVDFKPVEEWELDYAAKLEAKHNSGQPLTEYEVKVYDDIKARYDANLKMGKVNNTQNNQTTQLIERPSDQELQFAVDLEKRAQANQPITEQELIAYQDIKARLEAWAAQQEGNNVNQTNQTNEIVPPSQQELEWAAQLMQQKANGATISEADLAKYTDIYNRYNGIQTNTNNNTNNVSYEDFSYNSSTIQTFRETFQGYNLVEGGVPYLSPADGASVAQQLGFNSVEALQSSVGASVDGKFGPETLFMATKASGQGQNNTNGVNSTQNNPVYSQGTTVTEEEIAWAAQLMEKRQNQQPVTADEVARYNDIYKRYEANGFQASSANNTQNVSTNTGYSNTATTTINLSGGDAELEWALQLLESYKQGHTPSEQEIARYEQIIARNQATVN